MRLHSVIVERVITIGVTGGMATGKSEVARLLARGGARTIDADRVAHETYTPGTDGFRSILAAFGGEVVAEDGSIDRRALGRVAFADPKRLRALTGIVWPLTRARVEQLQREAAADKVAVFVIEAVALRQAGWQDLVDVVWLVTAPREQALARLRQRGGLSEDEAAARLAAQAKTDAAGADAIIDNSGDLATLEAQVDAALQAALSRPR